ncbi:MAG: Spo0E family sporulation regulatory protein-aspartic acid phosphatase [Clostridiales bacterium]|jgi:hypothetical protein|nr:Spo0E family sporulation regulatory protein-aspartic acid phosphatase [Eubacteriales bacterium]MDH7567121.1 Spo0E family sporulation regulatory protein-aspartic acid phosphatase [Clostridiales bacterium]
MESLKAKIQKEKEKLEKMMLEAGISGHGEISREILIQSQKIDELINLFNRESLRSKLSKASEKESADP